MNATKSLRAPKPAAPKFTLADRLVVAGQRLRANESVVRRTLALTQAAQWIQAKGAQR